MKKEIVYTDKYALILSDEPIIHNKYGFHIINRTISKIVTFNGYDWKDIIAHLPLSNAPILEGVPLLPPLPQGDDVDALAKSQFRKSEYEIKLREEAFQIGYNKAKEKYKYIEEDIRRAITLGWDGDLSPNEIIQSLQQPSRPTHFECDMLCGRCRAFDDECFSAKECTRGYDFSDIMRTTTNSQGQVELVGKYLNL